MALVAWLSTVLLWAGAAIAHEVRPAISDLTVQSDRILLVVEASAEAMIAGVDLSEYSDTNNAPQAEEYDRLRALIPPGLEAELRAAWPRLAEGFDLRSGTVRLEPVLEDIRIPFVDDPDLARDTTITLSAALPPGGDPVTVAWAPAYGPLVLRQVSAGDGAYTAYLEPGVRSQPIPREGALAASAGVVEFVWQGVLHVVPKGLDHALFILALFFFAQRAGPLLWQVAAFTVAHTVTLWLASFGIVAVSPRIVEPLIAASLVYVAVDNIMRPEPGWMRVVPVFGFGLLHGLGLASALSALAASPPALGLIGFNLGVEIGQLAVIAAAFLTVGLWFREKPYYRRFVVVPASLMVALIGAYWFVERTVLV